MKTITKNIIKQVKEIKTTNEKEKFVVDQFREVLEILTDETIKTRLDMHNKKKRIKKIKKDKVYLEYLNNFLTVRGIADHYGVPVKEMRKIINEGRKQHEK